MKIIQSAVLDKLKEIKPVCQNCKQPFLARYVGEIKMIKPESGYEEKKHKQISYCCKTPLLKHKK
jgi:hypothetical protein